MRCNNCKSETATRASQRPSSLTRCTRAVTNHPAPHKISGNAASQMAPVSVPTDSSAPGFGAWQSCPKISIPGRRLALRTLTSPGPARKAVSVHFPSLKSHPVNQTLRHRGVLARAFIPAPDQQQKGPTVGAENGAKVCDGIICCHVRVTQVRQLYWCCCRMTYNVVVWFGQPNSTKNYQRQRWRKHHQLRILPTCKTASNSKRQLLCRRCLLRAA